MGALSPLFLVAAAAVAIPLYLHLVQAQEARRVAFPALRYLERTEREHARRIRSRQILLLLLRVAAVLAVVGAGAGLFLRGGSTAHAPTALAIVLDNSMSSGRVEGGRRVLDELTAMALVSLRQATEQDRVWLIRAGEPWLPSAPGSPHDARRAVEATRVSAAGGDLEAALSRAAELVNASGLEAREIHLLSDLQASGFSASGGTPAGDVPVVVWVPPSSPGPQHALGSVVVGGGLSPLAGQRSEVTVTLAPPGHPGDTAAVAVRLVVDGGVRGGAQARPGAAVALPLPEAGAGWTLGWVEADPDALSADDRRYFAFRARPAPRIAVAGEPGVFVEEALAVLSASGRVLGSGPHESELLVSAAGEGLAEQVGGSVVVLPSDDPVLLPALNRNLEAAGIPWRFAPPAGRGEVELVGAPTPSPLVGAWARHWHRLALAADPPAPSRTLVTAGGDPWAVEGTDARGRRYLLLASPLDSASTSLPVSAAMVPWLDWLTGAWATEGSSSADHEAGTPLSAPRDVDAVRVPSGAVIPLDGTRILRATGEAGHYALLAGDTVVGYRAVNPPRSESVAESLPTERVGRAVGPQVVLASGEADWRRSIFQARQGSNLAAPLAFAALAILLVEAAVASAGRRRGGERKEVHVAP